MLDRFWEGVGNQFGERFVLRALGPALVFWAGLLFAYKGWWLSNVAAPSTCDGKALESWLVFGIPVSDTWLIFGAIAAIMAIATSASLIEPFVLPVLRLLEGYWGPVRGFRSSLVTREIDRRRELDDRWRSLATIGIEHLSGPQRDEYARLDLALRLIPSDPALVMPTRLGNILRSAERRPEARYGLAPMVCWAPLWLVVPEDARTELAEARERLDGLVRGFIFSVLFAVAGSAALWPIALGAVAAVVCYRLMLAPAEVYGDLLFAVFTLYRTDLYRSLRWPVPVGPHDERAHGEALTQYLFRGGAGSSVRFTDDAVAHERTHEDASV